VRFRAILHFTKAKRYVVTETLWTVRHHYQNMTG
jgi:hypothetical protein